MILKPSIDSLLKEVPSKYPSIILVGKRAHELDEGVQPTIESFDSIKSVGRALEEIEVGAVTNNPNPEEKRERLRTEREERKCQCEQEQEEPENRLRNEKN